MINRARMIKQLQRHEGLRLKPYHCSAGKLTIGYGRNLEDIGITQDEADMLLGNDLAKVCVQCQREFDWFDGLSELRKEAIINLVFNMGLEGFKQFRRTIAFIEAGQFIDAGAELLDSRYARQVGKRANEIASQLADG